MEPYSSGAGGDAGRDVDEFGPDRAGPCFGEHALGEDPGSPGEVVGHDSCDEPCIIRTEVSRGQVGQCTVLEVGVDLFDDGVAAVGLIGCDRVQVLSSDGGEEGVEAVRVKECRLPVNGFGDSALRMRRTTNRPVTCSLFFLEVNAVYGTSATSAAKTHASVASSKTAFVYWIGTHAESGMPVMARLTAGSMLIVTETCAPPARAAAIAGWP